MLLSPTKEIKYNNSFTIRMMKNRDHLTQKLNQTQVFMLSNDKKSNRIQATNNMPITPSGYLMRQKVQRQREIEEILNKTQIKEPEKPIKRKKLRKKAIDDHKFYEELAIREDSVTPLVNIIMSKQA